MNTTQSTASQSVDSAMTAVGKAFVRALKSQFHPKMIFALFLPILVTMFLAILLLWFGWTPVTDWLSGHLTQSSLPQYVDPVIGTTGFLILKAWMIPIIAVIILLPLAGIIGLAVAAVWVMPLVINHLSRNHYPDVQRRGRHAFLVSLWNAVWVTLVFVVGWLITLPLWLIPPLGLVFSTFWWTFAYTRMLRVDAIVDHASPDERKILLKRCNLGFWLIGLACALINLLPPAWVFLPVFSGLVFTHFGLEALRQERKTTLLQGSQFEKERA